MRLLTTVQILLGITTTVIAVPATRPRPRSLDAADALNGIDGLLNIFEELPSPPLPSQSSQPPVPVTDVQFDPSDVEFVNPPFDPQWILRGSAIDTAEPALPQIRTNGLSALGTFDASRYALFKGQNTLNGTAQIPWGQRTAKNTNTYTNPPDTGVTQHYDFTVERAILAPDGVPRSMILVNGEFPGPTIEANWGDIISITVHNKITAPNEGTSIHWHGFLQKATPYEDGVPGITQCPIPPGESYTYTFQADLYGTSWWHAHMSAQYMAGLYGAIIVHGPVQPEAKYDSDLGPLLISDYFHQDYFSLVQDVMSTDKTKQTPKSVNNMFNGKGLVNCSNPAQLNAYGILPGDNSTCINNAGLAKFNVTSGSTYRLRLVNAGAEGIQKFSIDDHELTVIAYDFVPIVPYTAKVVTLGIGQRADVLIKANQNASSAYWIRSVMTKCALTNQPNALAILYYNGVDPNTVPIRESLSQYIDTTNPCANDDLSTAVPYYPITPPSVPTVTRRITLNMTHNATGMFEFTLDGSSFRTDYNRPILQEAVNGVNSSTFPREWNVYDFGGASSIRIILDNLTPISHPMHIHGHNMYVLSSTSTILDNPPLININNPTRRDVQILEPFGQIVIQIDADNPGSWPFHCHIAWHVSSGLYMNILEHPDVLKGRTIPDGNLQLCKSWDTWSNSNTVMMIDSGLKARAKSNWSWLTDLFNRFAS